MAKNGKGRPVYLRAAIDESTEAFLDDQARASGRAQVRHCGRVLQAYAQVSLSLPARDRAYLDELVGRPAELAKVFRRVLLEHEHAEDHPSNRS